MLKKVNWEQGTKMKANILQNENPAYKASQSLQQIGFGESPGSQGPKHTCFFTFSVWI